ncbi:MAG: hypothetical protein HQL84_04765 [Magnetococcales bacterium]|nr:hypothetical protein [Magnetococcales bacterium]MBF0149341.1 hypothetical protein [Magnetococcales bacterium]MBF0173352.1 hypothetical protein [Magnetococcales bacterium]MBF0348845.1 hypothetical protein [Magnetococcales bacterium]
MDCHPHGAQGIIEGVEVPEVEKGDPVVTGGAVCLFLLAGGMVWMGPVPVGAEVPSSVGDSAGKSMLGRLFNAPEQRILLDRLRREGGTVAGLEKVVGQEEGKQQAPVVKGPRYVSVTGMVFKENGTWEIWLDGKSLPRGKDYQGEGFTAFLTSATPAGLPVSSVDSPEVFMVKPGQTLDFVDKRVVRIWDVPAGQRASARREPPPEGEGATEDQPEGQSAKTAAKEVLPVAAGSTAGKKSDQVASNPEALFQVPSLPPGTVNPADVMKFLGSLQSLYSGMGAAIPTPVEPEP